MNNLAFYRGLELSFVYGALSCSSAVLGLMLRNRDYNLAAVTKIKWGFFDKDYEQPYKFSNLSLPIWNSAMHLNEYKQA